MDLTELMRSPGLALDPPSSLEAAVRRRARVVRLRRRLAGAALIAAIGSAAAVVGPALLPDDERPQVAHGLEQDYGIRGATSEVLLLDRLNDAAVVAWYEGSELCVATIRVKRSRTCAPGVSAATTAAFPHVLPLDAVRVDDRRLLVGQVRVDAATLWLDLEGRPPLVVTVVSGRGFPVPVMYAEVPRGTTPVGLRALALDGSVLAERAL